MMVQTPKILRRSAAALGLALLLQGFAHAADVAAFAAPAAQSVTTTPGIGRVTLSLLLVMVLLFGIAWLVKRFSGLGIGHSSRIRQLASLSLGARERAVLIEFDGRELLLGVAPGSVRTLHVGERRGQGVEKEPMDAVTMPGDVAADGGRPVEFKALLASVLKRSLGR